MRSYIRYNLLRLQKKDMPYTQLKVVFQDNIEIASEILIAELSELEYESFEENTDGISAYVSSELFDEAATKRILEDFSFTKIVESLITEIEDQNWNEEWEKNFFEPICIGDECLVKSSFHKTEAKAKYEILIDPKMSFGTGHHETTSLVLQKLLAQNVEGKDVLDMGCGTAILAILAKMKGAGYVEAIDNDEWAYNNSLENIRLNYVEEIVVKHGDATALGDKLYDLVIANINRNILLTDMAEYVKVMKPGAVLLMSGFYQSDIPFIQEKAESLGLTFDGFNEKKKWVVTAFIK